MAAEDPLLTLESDKATMDVPSPAAGTITAVVGRRHRLGRAHLIHRARHRTGDLGRSRGRLRRAAAPYTGPKGDVHAEVLVLGAGPGGYTAAFRAADLGQKVVLVDGRGPLGGVCLNVGCIPSKALLHAAKVIAETKEMAAHGISFAAPTIDLDGLRGWKDGVVSRLTGGLAGLAKQRKVTTVVGTGRFTSPTSWRSPPPTAPPSWSASTRPSSPPAPSRCSCRSSRTTTRGSSTPPARWT